MGQEKLYIEKELSWLAFNERVLQEAADKSNPLIERMRFLGIYSNNLDEFYKVRFAELKRRIIISEEQGLNSHSRHLLGKIQSRVLKADQEFDGLYNELLLEMARNQIFLILSALPFSSGHKLVCSVFVCASTALEECARFGIGSIRQYICLSSFPLRISSTSCMHHSTPL